MVGRDGELISTVEMPDGFIPMDIRGNRVLGLTRDELGVERVSVYEILTRDLSGGG